MNNSIKKILKTFDRPVTVPEILKHTSVNKTTVYRNLYKLVEENKVREIHINPNITHYELAHTHHHHLVCKNCGEIKDVESSNIENTINDLKQSLTGKFLIEDHNLEFFGHCVKCSS